MRKPLVYTLCLTLVPTLLAPTLLHFPLTFLAPLVAFLVHQLPLLSFLWSALSCGLAMDILTSDLPFGLFSLAYTLSAVFVWRQRRRLGLPLLTALFSATSSLLLILTGTPQPLIIPLLDGMYALLFISVPLTLLFRHRPQTSYRMARPQ